MSDWALPQEVHAFLHRNLAPGSKILELGSGIGTLKLREVYDVVSVEHDPQWCHKIEGHRYIYAPIVNGWYDVEILSRELPDDYDCLLVDGPPGHIGRHGALEFQALFLEVPVVFDDAHRQAERDIAMAWAEKRGQSISLHGLTNGRGFATAGWM